MKKPFIDKIIEIAAEYEYQIGTVNLDGPRLEIMFMKHEEKEKKESWLTKSM